MAEKQIEWMELYPHNQEFREFVICSGTLRLSVHRTGLLEGWYATCREVGMDCVALSATNSDEAKKEAVSVAIYRAGMLTGVLFTMAEATGMGPAEFRREGAE